MLKTLLGLNGDTPFAVSRALDFDQMARQSDRTHRAGPKLRRSGMRDRAGRRPHRRRQSRTAPHRRRLRCRPPRRRFHRIRWRQQLDRRSSRQPEHFRRRDHRGKDRRRPRPKRRWSTSSCASRRNQIDLQVKTAQLNLETARKRISFAEKAFQSAEESLGLTRERFEEGLALSTQLIDAESALTGTRVQLSGARADEQIALAELRHALGLPIRDHQKTRNETLLPPSPCAIAPRNLVRQDTTTRREGILPSRRSPPRHG